MSLNRRHRAVTLLENDGQIVCPGGGSLHPLETRGRLHGEGFATFECRTCGKCLFVVRGKYGLLNAWELGELEFQIVERMSDARQILDYLNRDEKRVKHA